MPSTTANPYSVTGVKSFRGREGYGFNANLHRDGRKVAFVMDDADGGEFNYEWSAKDRAQARADEQALADYCKTLPPVEFQGASLTMNADLFLGELVEAAENAQRLARHVRIQLKKHVVFVAEGKIRASAAPPTAALIASFAAKYPGAMILNNLPPVDAVALYAKHAAVAA